MANGRLKKDRLRALLTDDNRLKFAHALRKCPYNPLIAAQDAFGDKHADLCVDIATDWINDQMVRKFCDDLADKSEQQKAKQKAKPKEMVSHEQLAREIYDASQQDMDPKTRAVYLDLVLKCTGYAKRPSDSSESAAVAPVLLCPEPMLESAYDKLTREVQEVQNELARA